MRWFMDTELDENGSTIKLISIALVSEDGRLEYYRALKDGWETQDCDPWVRANVVPLLPPPGEAWATRADVAADLRVLLLGPRGATKPQIWGYFADYDWVVFCQLFGKMVDLPEGMPMLCMDLKQEMVRRGITKDMLPEQKGSAHNALEDARWIREAYVAAARAGWL